MIRPALILALALGASACASGGRDGGYASYDALRATQQACAAKGMTMRLKTEGNAQSIDGYACERK
ncbi:MAG: hypothetical protein JWQ46_1555 [Phenylobacterium sp.]|nr:hypothetical protein [Phenylobacterium sp.]